MPQTNHVNYIILDKYNKRNNRSSKEPFGAFSISSAVRRPYNYCPQCGRIIGVS